ncbi:MAG: DUF3107 domain-containing protein [Microbacterium sp.]|uniref:DUF3107 domain-containing protein n=1 Tax=Microbacterium sp. TaxID=51671 RepID=UPI002611D5D0|nr:DUF3107 domain-containing protein [Microbacterium sp.]MCX6502457.1 DUF3107 domain-containing protein [Microbacterium sp.]
MEIRIGIANTGRELSFETNDSAETVKTSVADALGSGAPFITFTDVKGSSYIVPSATLAYVELGTDQTRRVGFFA